MKDQLSTKMPNPLLLGVDSAAASSEPTSINFSSSSLDPPLFGDLTTASPSLLKETTNLTTAIKVKQQPPSCIVIEEIDKEIAIVKAVDQLNGTIKKEDKIKDDDSDVELVVAVKSKKAKSSTKSSSKAPSKSKGKTGASPVVSSITSCTTESASTSKSTSGSTSKSPLTLTFSLPSTSKSSSSASTSKSSSTSTSKSSLASASTSTASTSKSTTEISTTTPAASDKPSEKPKRKRIRKKKNTDPNAPKPKRGRPFGALTKSKPTKRSKAAAKSKSKAKPKPIPASKQPASTSKRASSPQKVQIPLVTKRTRFIGPVVRITRKSKPIHHLNTTPEQAHRTELRLDYDYTLLNRQLLTDSKGNPIINDDQPTSTSSAPSKVTQVNKLMAEMESSSTANWLCSLCHKGPNEERLGDLYGPYYVEMMVNPEQDSALMPPPADRCKLVMAVSKKRSRFVPPTPPRQPAQPRNQRVELWFHEDCIVWTPNVVLFEGQLTNIKEAMEDAQKTVCVFCRQTGANIACIDRFCYFKALHFPCAKSIGCYFDESRLSVFCEGHYDLLRLDPRASQQFCPRRILNF